MGQNLCFLAKTAELKQTIRSKLHKVFSSHVRHSVQVAVNMSWISGLKKHNYLSPTPRFQTSSHLSCWCSGNASQSFISPEGNHRMQTGSNVLLFRAWTPSPPDKYGDKLIQRCSGPCKNVCAGTGGACLIIGSMQELQKPTGSNRTATKNCVLPFKSSIELELETKWSNFQFIFERHSAVRRTFNNIHDSMNACIFSPWANL